MSSERTLWTPDKGDTENVLEIDLKCRVKTNKVPLNFPLFPATKSYLYMNILIIWGKQNPNTYLQLRRLFVTMQERTNV